MKIRRLDMEFEEANGRLPERQILRIGRNCIYNHCTFIILFSYFCSYENYNNASIQLFCLYYPMSGEPMKIRRLDEKSEETNDRSPRRPDNRRPSAGQKNIHPSGQLPARVTIHPDTHTLVIGDSNLRRMNGVPDGWQLEGFCGCKCHHLREFLTRVIDAPKIQLRRVILSVGINDGCFRGGRTDLQYKKAAIEELMKAKSTLEDQYRGVEVFIPLVTFARGLSTNEQCSIQDFNRLLEQTEELESCLIPSLPESDVTTVPGQAIHYDERTATRMLAAWADHLDRE